MSFKHLGSPVYSEFIYKRTYSRWIEEENRRENWEETVDRYVNFLEQHCKNTFKFDLSKKGLKKALRDGIYNLDIMPSMRALMTAGSALERCNVAGYNCAYLPIDHIRCFDESLYILMCGTGVGFSVERKYVDQLPIINEHFENSDTSINVADSKAGWARGLKELVSLLVGGQVPRWDLSRLRPKGARLKTFGGRSSGPDPLDELFSFTVELFKSAAGRRLTSIECHDLMCKIGEVVVVGGVRRSALISLSNLTDDRMRKAKSGRWWDENSQRRLANNSVVYTEKPDAGCFLEEWRSLYDSKSGERGIFNRKAAIHQATRFGHREVADFGTNPCSEIILRPYQFCNLTEVVVRSQDTAEALKEKVKLATILGTIQSSLTDFKYLRKIWRNNCEEERLLGVSLTGIMDSPLLNGINDNYEEIFEELKWASRETNKIFAKQLGISPSTAITCVKPSGTVSQLVDSSSGIHPRFAKYYIRRVRADANDPLAKFMQDQGIPYELDVMNKSNIIFSFPMKAPKHALVNSNITAIGALDYWKDVQEYWCEHKPSITVSVREDEWLRVGAWVYDNFDVISGISFLPFSDHTYKQAPYEEITKEEYDLLIDQIPTEINWDKLSDYEQEDNTIGSQEFACVGSSCEIVDILN